MDTLISSVLRLSFVARPIFHTWLGFMFGALAMAYIVVLLHSISVNSPCGSFVSYDTPSLLSVWIQAPPYVLIVISEVLASGLDYAYNKVPKWMKSAVTSIFGFLTAIGNAVKPALA